MAKEQVIEFVLDEEGNIEAEKTCGDAGPTCEKEIEEILVGVGKKTASKRRPEFYQATTTSTAVKRRN